METDLDYYEMSDFPKDHPLHSQKNKKVLGKMKDECAGALIFQKRLVYDPECIQSFSGKREKHQKSKRHNEKCNQEANIA